MKFLSIIGKTVVVAAALIVGVFAASQAGWSGAELVVNSPIMGMVENFLTGILFTIGSAVTIGTVVLIQRLAKGALWLVVPILLYVAAVPGAWNGFASDFDATRGEAIKHGYANAYALEHMSARGRYLTCNDGRIKLTDDGKEVCARALTVGPGEPIPGSEHRCGLLGMFGCFNTAPGKG
jgi:hypothetical protein